MRDAVQAWFELMRVSNLPTVWSNVVHGMAAGLFVVYVLPVEAIYGQRPGFSWMDLGRMLDAGFMLMLGMSLIYTGGMVLNDVVDREVDAGAAGAADPQRPGLAAVGGNRGREYAAVGRGVRVGLRSAGGSRGNEFGADRVAL